MSFRVRAIAILFFLGLTFAGGLGLAAMTGGLSALMSGNLKAEMVLNDYPLPSGFGVAPQEVSDFLVAEMQGRVLTDVALRLVMGSDNQQKLHDVVIPRLINAGVIRKMIGAVQPLADVLSLGQFKSTAQIKVHNGGTAALADVAMIIPGALRAQDSNGIVPITETQPGLSAIKLGDMAPGADRSIIVWRSAAVDFSPDAISQFSLGAADGVRGQLEVLGTRDWLGAGLEKSAWARWLVAGLLVALTFAGLIGLATSLRAALPRRRRNLPDTTAPLHVR
ncbi:MAG: hypothetical protein KDJ19_02940 [Hyphomicrobiaceae bacterium]|nr:hypothetical protein [Hyphomicrobiaceae bacterium]MCC0025061.1 hypothetical protein [Hyphomicrobiaceae bacterium]